MLTILFDGIAYGMLLFVLACGLSVTLGLMNSRQSRPRRVRHGGRLHHGRRSSTAWASRSASALPLAFLSTAALGALLERTLYVHVYAKSHLDQVLFTIGLVFMSVAAVDYVMGSSQQFVRDPADAAGPDRRVRHRRRQVSAADHRRLRPAHDRAAARADEDALRQPAARRGRRSAVARGLGINVNAVFALTFAVGLGARRPWRRARRGDSRPRSDLSAEIHDLLPDRRDGRRDLEHHRAVPRLDPARHRRRRGQVLRAEARRLRRSTRS